VVASASRFPFAPTMMVGAERGSAMRVLVVDDQEGWLAFAVRRIERLMHAAVGAPTFEGALEEIANAPYDAGIFDVNLMPGFGFDLIRPFRARNPDARVLVLTALPEYRSATLAFHAGADDYALSELASIERFLRGERAAAPAPSYPTLEQMKREYVHQVVNDAKGNRSAAARRLGLHRQSLQRLLRKRPP
jgi:two-component system, response regulator RegA